MLINQTSSNCSEGDRANDHSFGDRRHVRSKVPRHFKYRKRTQQAFSRSVLLWCGKVNKSIFPRCVAFISGHKRKFIARFWSCYAFFGPPRGIDRGIYPTYVWCERKCSVKSLYISHLHFKSFELINSRDDILDRLKGLNGRNWVIIVLALRTLYLAIICILFSFQINTCIDYIYRF